LLFIDSSFKKSDGSIAWFVGGRIENIYIDENQLLKALPKEEASGPVGAGCRPDRGRPAGGAL